MGVLKKKAGETSLFYVCVFCFIYASAWFPTYLCYVKHHGINAWINNTRGIDTYPKGKIYNSKMMGHTTEDDIKRPTFYLFFSIHISLEYRYIY